MGVSFYHPKGNSALATGRKRFLGHKGQSTRNGESIATKRIISSIFADYTSQGVKEPCVNFPELKRSKPVQVSVAGR